MYLVTTFNAAHEVVNKQLFFEYPQVGDLQPAEWIDICRASNYEMTLFDLEDLIYGSSTNEYGEADAGIFIGIFDSDRIIREGEGTRRS